MRGAYSEWSPLQDSKLQIMRKVFIVGLQDTNLEDCNAKVKGVMP